MSWAAGPYWLAVAMVVGVGCSQPPTASPGPDRAVRSGVTITLPNPPASQAPAEPSARLAGVDRQEVDRQKVEVQEDVQVELAAMVAVENNEWTECTTLPQECRIHLAFAEVLADPLLTLTREAAQRQRNLGLETLPPLDPDHDRVEILGIEPDAERPGHWHVRFCSIDGRIIIDPGAGPNGADVIVDDEIRSSLRILTARRNDAGELRFIERQTLRTEAGSDGCRS